MASIRQQLSAAAPLSTVKDNRVVLVTGETGSGTFTLHNDILVSVIHRLSGKSTQLPAYILEDGPSTTKIIVTDSPICLYFRLCLGTHVCNSKTTRQ
jgi:excinuclease UvrABC ATPase subunit